MPELAAHSGRRHTLTLDNRQNLVLTGISEVTSYDGTAIVVTSEIGELVVQGKSLHISSFDQSSGKLSVEGTIDAVQYTEVRQKPTNLFARLLK